MNHVCGKNARDYRDHIGNDQRQVIALMLDAGMNADRPKSVRSDNTARNAVHLFLFFFDCHSRKTNTIIAGLT